MSNPARKKIYLVLLFILPIGFVALLKQGTFKAGAILPIYGDRYLAAGAKDTTYHTVGPFSFTDQKGFLLTNDSVKGKIRIVNFFFARCQGVCPKMNNNLTLVYDKYKQSPDIVFISHTVDPENDSTEVLAEYARVRDIRYGNWFFVTGKYEQIAFIQNQYLLPKADGASADQIAHSQHLILVDKEERIRGAYDGLKMNEVLQLKEDIKLLLAEYKNPL
ncbi:MAG: SCO family protein [Bacteroidetes bacterium]|nr:MAG: SCO family protein [Bacteroidota bacterium]